MDSKLFIVGTPIGNLNDISKRMIDTLNLVDVIYAEDTRLTLKLLNHIGIKKPLRSSHKDNEFDNIEAIFDEISSGKSVAIVSDAGMPTISDPGSIIIKTALERNTPLEVIPSPTALISALVMSGMSGGDFYFYGFLSHDKSKKRKEIDALKKINSKIILYESPHRVTETLHLIIEIIGKRVAVCREITKLYENCTFVENINDINKIATKGEFTLVIDNHEKIDNEKIQSDSINIDINDFAKQLLQNGLSSTDTLTVLKTIGVKRNDAYKLIERLK